ncbi:PDC sensor domain-containing protein, partial [Campylobacter sp. TTU_617]|uniref:PDC sensor domain-containing protein n=1 Tax=Campylobacter sp. TTU_617 TaxID=2768148 RepID=UPI0019079479
MSLKFKVSLVANLIAIFCLGLLGIITYIFINKSIYHEVVNAETNYIKVAKNSMINFSKNNSDTLENFSKRILSFSYNQLNNQQALMENIGDDLKLLREAGGFLAAYIAQPDGELVVSDTDSDAKGKNFGIYGKADNYDARTRDYYQEALKTNGIYITPSYIDITSNLPCFTYSKALYKDGKFIGVLAIDVLVEELQKEFETNPGRTFVFDKNNKVFASTDKEQLKEGYNIDQIANIAKTKADLEPFEYQRADGSQRFGICTKIGDYTACIAESLDVIKSSANKMAYIQIIVVIIMIALSIILLYVILSKLLSPLTTIQNGLNSFFDFINHKTNNVSTINIKTNDEFGQI